MDQEAFFSSPLEGFYTLRDLAAELRVPLAHMKDVVERSRMSHARRHGVVRLWSEADLVQLRRRFDRATRPSTPST